MFFIIPGSLTYKYTYYPTISPLIFEGLTTLPYWALTNKDRYRFR